MKPKFRWTQLLQPIGESVSSEAEAKMKRGKQIHEKVYEMFPKWIKETTGEYTEDDLPFIIIYHADLYSEESRILIEVKPFVWGIDKEDLHIEQVSGYSYFLKARKTFFLYYYWEDFPDGLPILVFREVTDDLKPWCILRQRALNGFKVLKG